jgi:PAS domain S-box-containing protein
MQEPTSFEELVNLAQDKIVVVDEEGMIRYANAATRDLLGYEPADLLGVDVVSLIHPDDRARVVDAFRTLVDAEPGTVARARYRYETRSGEWVHVESRLSNEHSEELGGYVVSSRDVTDRVEIERERERTRNRLFELASESPDVHWMISADWSELLFVNDAVEEIYGIGVDRLREDPETILESVHPEDVPMVADAMARLSEGEPVDMEYRVNPGEEFGRWVWVQGRPIVEDGSVERIVGFARDITDRHRRNRHLRVMDNLLRHNLRNDMNVVLGHAELLKPAADPAEAAHLESIESTGRKLLAKADKQRRIIELIVDRDPPVPLDLREIVDDVVAAVRAEGDGIEIEVDVPASLSVAGIPQLENAVRELVDNAIRHARGDPRVRIEARTRDGCVDLVIADDCDPIPPSEMGVLSGEDPRSATHHGTGLGLWLVYWTVELSGGEIHVDRDEDDGNRIVLRLPVEVDGNEHATDPDVPG